MTRQSFTTPPSSRANILADGDPILSLIHEYRDALAALEARQIQNDDAYLAAYRRECQPIHRRIRACRTAATSVAGVQAAVVMARAEWDAGETEMIPHLLDAAIGFFKTGEFSR